MHCKELQTSAEQVGLSGPSSGQFWHTPGELPPVPVPHTMSGVCPAA